MLFGVVRAEDGAGDCVVRIDHEAANGELLHCLPDCTRLLGGVARWRLGPRELLRWRPGEDDALIVDRASPAGAPGGIACAEGRVTSSEFKTVEPFGTSVYIF